MISSSTLAGVAGLMATPARFPNALIRCTVRDRSVLPSQWTKNESVPACANSSRKKSGLKIIKCVSSGRRVTRRSDLTTTAPMDRFGTKCPSITSTWIRSAPARSASATCSPKQAKSALRMDGASLTVVTLRLCGFGSGGSDCWSSCRGRAWVRSCSRAPG